MVFAFIAGWLFATGRPRWGWVALAGAVLTYDWSVLTENPSWLMDRVA